MKSVSVSGTNGDGDASLKNSGLLLALLRTSNESILFLDMRKAKFNDEKSMRGVEFFVAYRLH